MMMQNNSTNQKNKTRRKSSLLKNYAFPVSRKKTEMQRRIRLAPEFDIFWPIQNSKILCTTAEGVLLPDCHPWHVLTTHGG